MVTAQNGRKKIKRVLIGGVGYRWQRDASVGLVLSDALEKFSWPAGIEVADLGYGAIYAAQDIAAAEPPYDKLILLAGIPRGRESGRVYKYRWDGMLPDHVEIQERVREAGAGVIDLDHLLVIGQHFDALPDEVVVIEVEPCDVGGGEGLSIQVEALLPQMKEMVRQEAFV